MRSQVFLAALFLMLPVAAIAAADNFKDPLELPAARISTATSTQLSAVTLAGSRLIAVGINGLIITSDDNGKTWQQATVPSSSDLVAVQFLTPLKGWAVGHDGIVLHSEDGGSSWTRQFDGRMAKTILMAHFQVLKDQGDPDADRLLSGVALNYGDGPEQALLDVWFWNENEGFVVGSFGTLFATHDGGKSWESWMERVDADDFFHFNAIRGIGSDIFIASEQGTVFKLDRQSQRFVPRETGYNGSLFNLSGKDSTVIAFGLRGAAYRSMDAGETWNKLPVAPGGTVSDNIVEDDRILAVTRSGQLIASLDQGESFRVIPVSRPMLFMGLAIAGDTVTIVGLSGVREVSLK